MTARAHPAIVAELRQQLRRVGGFYDLHRRLDEHAFYPRHDLRKESYAYAKVHRAMVQDEDLPCEVCGVRSSTLGKRGHNPYRAGQIETHHATIEWALANAVSLERFEERVVGPLAQLHPEKYAAMRGGKPVRLESGAIKPRRFTAKDMRAWIDHDRDNLAVLCSVHHRHKWFGIHAISGPIWGAQRILRETVSARIRAMLAAMVAGARGSR